MVKDFKSFDDRTEGIISWLSGEFNSIRTGRATPALLDGIEVESYGARVPLQQVGSVGIEDARTLRITPWSPDSIAQIEHALLNADLGLSVSTDSSGLRISFPELTSERRTQLIKLAKAKLEEARVSLRAARDEAMKAIDTAVKSGEMSEDDKFAAKEAIQKKVDERNEALNSMFAHKEKEINE